MQRPPPSQFPQLGMTSATGFGALLWIQGQAQEGPHSPLQPPLAGIIFSFCLPQLGWGAAAGQRGGAGLGLPARRLVWYTTELGSAAGGTSCPTKVHQFVGGIGGRRIWSHGLARVPLRAAPGGCAAGPLGPGAFHMSRADFGAGLSPESPLVLRSQPPTPAQVDSRGLLLSLLSSRGRPAYPLCEMVARMDIPKVIWEESGPPVTHPGPCGTRGLVGAKPQSEKEN